MTDITLNEDNGAISDEGRFLAYAMNKKTGPTNCQIVWDSDFLAKALVVDALIEALESLLPVARGAAEVLTAQQKDHARPAFLDAKVAEAEAVIARFKTAEPVNG